MMARLRADEAGLTLIELLVAAAMSVVIVGGGTSMLISAMRTQPQLSERSQKVTEVRWVAERMTKEIRNGINVETEDSSSTTVSFVAQVRAGSCGSSTPLASDAPAIECRVTYDCSSGTACTRAEGPKDVGGGTPKTLISGLESGAVFNYSPSLGNAEQPPTYVGLVFRIPNPSGSGALTVSDGASLRSAVLLSSG